MIAAITKLAVLGPFSLAICLLLAHACVLGQSNASEGVEQIVRELQRIRPTDRFETVHRLAKRFESSKVRPQLAPRAAGVVYLQLAIAGLTIESRDLQSVESLLHRATELLSSSDESTPARIALEQVQARLQFAQRASRVETQEPMVLHSSLSREPADWGAAASLCWIKPMALSRLFLEQSHRHGWMNGAASAARMHIALAVREFGETSYQAARAIDDVLFLAPNLPEGTTQRYSGDRQRIVAALSQSKEQSAALQRVAYLSSRANNAITYGRTQEVPSMIQEALRDSLAYGSPALGHNDAWLLQASWENLFEAAQLSGDHKQLEAVAAGALKLLPSNSHARLSVYRRVVRHLVEKGHAAESRTWIQALEGEAKLPGAPHDQFSLAVRELQEVLGTIVNDATEGSFVDRVSFRERYSLAPAPPKTDGDLRDWHDKIGNTHGSERLAAYELAVNAVRKGVSKISQEPRVEMILEWIRLSSATYSPTRFRILDDPLVSPSQVAGWSRTQRAKLLALTGGLQLARRNSVAALEQFEMALALTGGASDITYDAQFGKAVALIRLNRLEDAAAQIRRLEGSRATVSGDLRRMDVAHLRAILAITKGRSSEALNFVEAEVVRISGMRRAFGVDVLQAATERIGAKYDKHRGARFVAFRNLIEMLLTQNDDRCLDNIDLVTELVMTLHTAEVNVEIEEMEAQVGEIGFAVPAERVASEAWLIDSMVELAVRASRLGKQEVLQKVYPLIQDRLDRAQVSVPSFSAGRGQFNNNLVEMFETARLERALLSAGAPEIQEIVSARWIPTVSRRPASDRKSTFPKTFVHFITYSPTERSGGGACDLNERKSRRVAVFSIRGGKVAGVYEGPQVDEVRLQLETLLRGIDAGDEAADSGSLRWLYENMLAQPLATHSELAVHVWPAPGLPQMPYGLLLSSQAPEKLRRKPVVSLPTPSLYAALDAYVSSKRPAVVVASPDFGEPTLGIAPVSQLIHAKAEGDEVAGILGVAALSGKAASLQALLGIKEPSILHISTHGDVIQSRALKATTTNQDDPSYAQAQSMLAMSNARLALAGANERSGGLHSAGQITSALFGSLRLQTTGLVVLSSCSSSTTSRVVGTSLIGLQHAAHSAGAKTVVGTLWSIDDESTRRFMSRFYRHLGKGLTPAGAVAAAQSDMQDLPELARWRSPRHWGAFVVSGTNEPVVVPAER